MDIVSPPRGTALAREIGIYQTPRTDEGWCLLFWKMHILAPPDQLNSNLSEDTFIARDL